MEKGVGTGLFFLLEAIFYMVLLMIIYFNKPRLKTKDNKVYSFLIIVAILELFTELFLDIVGPRYQTLGFLSVFVAKLFCVLLLMWITTLCSYIVMISLDMKGKQDKFKKIKRIFYIVFFVNMIAIFILPIDFVYVKQAGFTTGPGVNLVYIFSFVFSFVGLACLIWNRKNIRNKKFLPMLIFLVLGGFCSFIQFKEPGLLLAVPVHAYITFIMYFTIENPDMKMVEELEKNRKLIDRNIEEKSNLLFELSHEVREPLKKINEISYNYKNTNSVEELQESLKEINEKANDMSLLVNDILDISITSRKNMQIYEETYNPEALFKKLVMKFKEENNNRITFSYSIPESMPKELYGDSVKIKQIVNTVLTNAFKYTKEGYVDLKVTNINKYDIARLIITVEDTGCGMSIDKVNDILNNNKEFTKEELDNLEKINIGIKLANKLVIEMGGILVIKSEENKGTKVTIIIDERIKEDNYNKMLEEDNYLKNIKIAILGDKTRKINKIRDILKDYEVKTYLEKDELIEQIKKKEKYDLIILFDDMKPSGIDVFKELKEIKGYKTPTVVLLEDNKISIKEHYIEDGFTDYLLLSNINEEIKKLDKYLKG